MKTYLALALCLASPVFADAEGAQPAATTVTVNIDRQPMEAALNAFAAQTGLQLLFHVEEVITPGLTAQRVVGTFRPERALQQLLRDSGLRFEFVNPRTVAIRIGQDSAAEPIADVDASKPTVSPIMHLAQTDDRSGTAVQAEAAASQDKNSRSETPADVSGRKIQEIVVTAQKREQRLMDVPRSIAVVTADDIDRRGLVSAEDYLRGLPGVNQVSDPYGQTIVIRGIETTTQFQNFFGSATVATYFGETPTSTTAGLSGNTAIDLMLMDVERVEVLRGPQGTSFGSAALGGAVRTIPVAPKLDRAEAKVTAGYSVTSGAGGDNHEAQAVGNLPLIEDKLALRAVAYRREQSGFYRNVAGSDAAFLELAAAPYGAEAFASNAEEVGTATSMGGRIAALFQPRDALKFTLSYLKQKTEVDGFAIANTGTYEQALLEVGPEHVIRGQELGVNDFDMDIANAIMEYDLGWGDLLATYSYLKSSMAYSQPFSAYGLAWPMSYSAPHSQRAHTGEIRLTTRLDGGWNFLAGLYAEKIDDEGYWEPLWFGSPESNFFAPGFSGRTGAWFDERELKQEAAFAEVSWEFLPGVTLTGGGRVYQYDRTDVGWTEAAAAGGGTYPPEADKVPINVNASGTSFRGNLSYKPKDSALIFAGWSQGFRLGRGQQPVPEYLCDVDSNGIIDGTDITVESTRIVNSDHVNSYELGGKFTLVDGRLLIAADVYRMDWSDVPVPQHCGGAGVVEWVANIGAGLSEGIEFQMNFYATEAFRVDIGGSWIRATLAEDAPDLNVFKGDRLPGSPEFNANLGLQYEFKIGGYDAFVRADPVYIGSFYGGLQQSPATKAGGYVKLDASARVALRNVDVDLFVRNLTNVDDFTFRGYIDLGLGHFYGWRLRPRTIGLKLSYRFGGQ